MTPLSRAAAVLAVALTLGLAACSGAAKQKPAPQKEDYLQRIDAYMERGRFKPALDLIDDRIRQEPGNYEHLLMRWTIYSAMQQDDKALADLDAALALFESKRRNYPPSEQNRRLALIHRDYALASLLAERRTQGEAAANYHQLFESHAAQVKALDEPTYAQLQAMIGGEDPDTPGAETPKDAPKPEGAK